ncbi:UNVERIFIED_CONTAM: hypothetical protein FKN15_038219 [Acipenser sinensis]
MHGPSSSGKNTCHLPTERTGPSDPVRDPSSSGNNTCHLPTERTGPSDPVRDPSSSGNNTCHLPTERTGPSDPVRGPSSSGNNTCHLPTERTVPSDPVTGFMAVEKQPPAEKDNEMHITELRRVSLSLILISWGRNQGCKRKGVFCNLGFKARSLEQGREREKRTGQAPMDRAFPMESRLALLGLRATENTEPSDFSESCYRPSLATGSQLATRFDSQRTEWLI